MLIANHKPIFLIGFENSTITQEAQHFLQLEFAGTVDIITPDDFIVLPNKEDYQYGVAFTLDEQQRKEIINLVEELNLDCFTYLHDTVVCYRDLKSMSVDEIKQIIGHGSFIAPYSSILLGAKLGKHCIVETYCLISHYVTLGNNCILHSGTMIGGRSIIGDNCLFNFKSAVLNARQICNDVHVNAVSTITKDIVEPGVYVGTPARKLGSSTLL